MNKEFNIILMLLSIVAVIMTAISMKNFFVMDGSSGTYEGYVIEKQGKLVIARQTLTEDDALATDEMHFFFPNEKILQHIQIGQKVKIVHGEVRATKPSSAHANTIKAIEE